MGKTLYLECSSGISGDMTVGALLDLGADWVELQRVLATVPSDGFEVERTTVLKSGLACTDFNVILEHDNHDHDMEYLHGDSRELFYDDENAVEEEHDHEHSHHHEHDHHHEHHHHDHIHPHEHRSLGDVYDIIDRTDMSERAAKTAKRIFEIIAEAESKAHGVSIDQVHFHEVGAIDSIVDIISVAVCLDNLDIEDVIVTKLSEGSGTVRCQHGILPVPVPAVVNIVSAYSIDIQLTNIKGELVTPTGAAVVAAIRTSNILPENMIIEKAGMGAGKRDYETSGILRAMIIREG